MPHVILEATPTAGEDTVVIPADSRQFTMVATSITGDCAYSGTVTGGTTFQMPENVVIGPILCKDLNSKSLFFINVGGSAVVSVLFETGFITN